ncbi:dihydroorotate dehydrogenase [Breznakiellaceae bacterium SP9]
MAEPSLAVTIAGLSFRNPVIAAAGTFGFGKEYAGLLDVQSLGGICTKALTLKPRAGNTGVRLWETPSGLINSIGLENPGIEAFIENELPALRQLGPVVIANLSGATIEEYADGARLLNQSAIDMIEVNISCPNVTAGGMAFGLDPDTAADVVRRVRTQSSKPLIVKLSPNAPNLDRVARACISVGANALSLVNTFRALAIDITTRKPVFDSITAGLSGPAIKPIALRMLWELKPLVNIPIIGIGGIATAADALEFLMAGALAVQVGTASFAHPAAMTDIISGIQQYMKDNCILHIEDLNIAR